MRIGAPRKPFDTQLSLSEWADNCETGLIGLHSPEELPQDMLDFIYTQFERFKIDTLDKKLMDEVVRVGAWASFYHLDAADPYLWLIRGLSDVAWSDLGYKSTIEIKHPWDDRTPEEANPDRLEVFEPAPGQAEKFFNQAMAMPGLQSLPYEIGEHIKFHLFEHYGGPEDYCSGPAIAGLQALCSKKGHLDKVMYNAYFELSAWAAFLWLVGPPGRDWRAGHHDVFWLCATEGIAVLYDMAFISESNYVIHARAPQSCCVCGLDSYCVELVYLEGMARFICEKHLNGTPLYQNATCGSKICKFAICPHHPMHGQEDAVYRSVAGVGQIVRLGEQKRGSTLVAASGQRLIANR